MRAKDVMTTNVVTVSPETTVEDIAKTMMDHRISAVPVVDGAGALIGIVSEGDLMRRPESETERHPSWWLTFIGGSVETITEYIKSHGRLASEVMTKTVVTASEETTLEEIATLLEENHIKRVPILRQGKLVGLVSRANLLHGLVAAKVTKITTVEDETIRSSILSTLRDVIGPSMGIINLTVTDGVVHLWGAVGSETERTAAVVVAENTAGVRGVESHIEVLPPMARYALWAE